MFHWKSATLILTGILIGCAGNAARIAYADSQGSSGGSSAKCLGPSGTVKGIEDDLNALIADGYVPFISAGAMGHGTVVCGKR